MAEDGVGSDGRGGDMEAEGVGEASGDVGLDGVEASPGGALVWSVGL